VNAKAKLNVPFGASLTGIPKLPPGSTISADDRFGEKPSGWIGFAKFVIVVCFIVSLLNYFYVLDAIAFRVTGEHYPAIFKQVPVDNADKKKEKDSKAPESGSTTNAPAATP
jgi:hypothetical protein